MSSKTVGIIGGGQLGMMLGDAIHNLGGKVIALDPQHDAPISKFADEFICASFDDLEALEKLGSKSDVITYEFENVKSEYLEELEKKYNIKQGLRPLFDSQDRVREKENARKHGLPTAKFKEVLTERDLVAAISEIGLPCVFKTRTLGYDGHGQVVIRETADIEKALAYLPAACIVEEFVDFDCEVSVIMVRGNSKTYTLPIGRNIHKSGILDYTVIPSGLDEGLLEKIKNASIKFMEYANYEGILCIEYFIKGDKFYFNEMAPRPHNSGHYSIEALDHSQYDLFARYLLDLEMVEPKIIHKAVMKNILGDDLELTKKKYDDNAFIHMYHKKESRPKRKMGHITFTDCDLDTCKKLLGED